LMSRLEPRPSFILKPRLSCSPVADKIVVIDVGHRR
jgi:hypothetical protein